MPTELGLYVILAYIAAWLFIAICGIVMQLHNRSSKRHGRYDGHYT